MADLVLRPRATVDVDALLAVALAYPGLTVVPRIEVDTLDTLPLLTYQLYNGRQLSNGPFRGGSSWTLSLTLFTDNLVTGSALADTVYQNVHDLEDSAPVPGVGFVATVDDVSMFDRVGSANLPDKRITQYAATFTIIVSPE